MLETGWKRVEFTADLRQVHAIRRRSADVSPAPRYRGRSSALSGSFFFLVREVVQKDFQARNLNREDAMDRSRWKKLIMIG